MFHKHVKNRLAGLAPEQQSLDSNAACSRRGVVIQNTCNCYSNEWALKNLRNWMEFRNKEHPDDLVPKDLLSGADVSLYVLSGCADLCRRHAKRIICH